jgi:hypothetical protein
LTTHRWKKNAETHLLDQVREWIRFLHDGLKTEKATWMGCAFSSAGAHLKAVRCTIGVTRESCGLALRVALAVSGKRARPVIMTRTAMAWLLLSPQSYFQVKFAISPRFICADSYLTYSK